ncbi:HAD family acid phosphatase [Streptomyces griseofuscus]|uniref:HAD family acid phosphatase n=1 Tax=Streptomyces TaxID=1883 RepID=UPI00081E86A7|nr:MULTISPECIES: HAD family acid phosphatase [unclassified Streptomyces]MBJ7002620.1 hydrolase [Streptomyces sp. CRPSP2-6A1]MYQ92126.1 hydrolase [Streptomyces sp. SID4946]SCF72346.1 HAD superfamily, subfamily IIIB (Acid phosphatase) [Streptomyces sp. DconLS]SCF84744.1 HAD superfamily, subfamily IIIB (Acid phosphatase) [Streptomyces sp. LamerLS-31b]
MTSPLARRLTVTAVSVAALAAVAAPAQAADATTAPATTAAASATTGKVDFATWQNDCQTVMDQTLPYLEQRIAAAKPGEKQAIVFDIDNTTLDTDLGFTIPQKANKPVFDVARYAQDHGVALFFVTARPGIIEAPTKWNLEYDGYQVSGIYVRGLFDLFKNVADYKTAQRVDIENKGYDIIANIGNSATDLSGGHADRTFKLPDYNGQLS